MAAPQPGSTGGLNWRRWAIVALAALIVAMIIAAIVKG